MCIDLGCDHLKELNKGVNANYSSHRVISEWIDVLSAFVDEEVLDKVMQS